MPALVLRADYDAARVRRLAALSTNADQVRRLLAIAGAYDGLKRGVAAQFGGMDRQILRDWVVRFNELGPEGLVDRKATGAPRRLTPAQEAEFASLVTDGPAAAGLAHLARWRCVDLQAVILERWGIDYHERTIGKLLDRLGFSHITGRPQHRRQKAETLEAFKKVSPRRSPRSARVWREARP